MIMNANGKWGKAARYLVEVATIPALLFFIVGPRIELLGITLGIGLLALPIDRKRRWAPLLPLGAAAAAVACGFRIRFITNPAGGYFYLALSSVPITFFWIITLLGARVELERRLPHQLLQSVIDVFLLMDAFLLVLISPQTRADPLAAYLPIGGMALLLIRMVLYPRREISVAEHVVIAFVLALFGISGAMKGAISISLLGPLVMMGVPLLITARTYFSSAAAKTTFLPHWFSAHRYSQGEFVIIIFILMGALTSASVIAAYYSIGYGFIPVLVLPALYLWHRLHTWVIPFIGEEAARGSLLGVRLSPFSLDQAVARVQGMIGTPGSARVVVTPNPGSLLTSRRDPVLRAAYDQADLVLADGIGIVWASRLLGSPLSTRVTGVDLSERLLARASTVGTRVFLLGGRPGVAARAAQRLKTRFPGLRIAGTHHGYFADDKAMIKRIASTASELILVGMGVPRQERFMLEARGFLPGAVMIGVGGTLDLFAGLTHRAPQGWQRLGLEWLYRLLHDPRRIKEAVLIPQFIAAVGAMWVASAFGRA